MGRLALSKEGLEALRALCLLGVFICLGLMSIGLWGAILLGAQAALSAVLGP